MGELFINVEPKRKSKQRVDRKSKATSKEQGLISQLSIENFEKDLAVKSVQLTIDISKADNSHLPEGAERYAYKPTSEYGIIYIPVNRLKQVYQTDDATNPRKVSEIKKKIKEGISLSPVQIGYNYDVHDGHHRIEASRELGLSHVPCEVVGTDPEKVKEAKKKYREVWKSTDLELIKSLDNDLQRLVIDNEGDEEKAIENYKLLLENITDPKVRPIIEEILNDEKDHYHNLKQVMEYIKGDEKALNKITKSLDLAFVIDLTKSHELHKGKLVKKRIPVRGKNGKVFYRMQWVDPNDRSVQGEHPGKDEATFNHHEDGIKDLEKRQSNKFPVRHMPLKDLKNTVRNYTVDKEAYQDALKKYHDGEKLPPVKVNPLGEILEGHYLVDMAKHLGLTHVPVIVMGNPKLKKDLEDRLKDQVFTDEKDEKTGKSEVVPINQTSSNNADDREPLSDDIIRDIDHFKQFTSKMYPRDYLMDQAMKQDIVWAEYTKDGKQLPANSNILWKNAFMAIEQHIKDGNAFTVARNEKEIDRRMKNDGKDNMHKYFLRLLESFDGDQDELMEWCRSHGISWKENKDPSKNWMNAVMSIKSELAKGRMIHGIRTRQKDAIEESNVMVTDQIKAQVKSYGQKYGKSPIMKRADDLGIVYDKYDKGGKALASNSSILWMRASEAIQRYIAKGNSFSMGVKADDGIKATVGDHGSVKLTKLQKYALDWAKRNSQNFEQTAREYATQCFKMDRDLDDAGASALYDKFMQNARNARVLVHIDPFEKLPSGVNLIDQLTADGVFKNDYYLNRGWDKEHREANERDVFGDDYNQADDADRPNYAVIDLFNRGLKSNMYSGEVAFVLKQEPDITKRSTGIAIDSDHVPYGEEGKWVKSLEDPHHLLIDRWYSKWKKPRKADGQRRRAMNAVLDGTPYTDDIQPFEAHLHGGLDFKRDVDHILVPSDWQTNKAHKDKHERVQQFAKLLGLSIKYE